MKEGEEIEYKRRKIYLNAYGEYCVCHQWGGLVAYNAGFDSLEKAQLYIRIITAQYNLMKPDFERIANEVKRSE